MEIDDNENDIRILFYGIKYAPPSIGIRFALGHSAREDTIVLPVFVHEESDLNALSREVANDFTKCLESSSPQRASRRTPSSSCVNPEQIRSLLEKILHHTRATKEIPARFGITLSPSPAIHVYVRQEAGEKRVVIPLSDDRERSVESVCERIIETVPEFSSAWFTDYPLLTSQLSDLFRRVRQQSSISHESETKDTARREDDVIVEDENRSKHSEDEDSKQDQHATDVTTRLEDDQRVLDMQLEIERLEAAAREAAWETEREREQRETARREEIRAREEARLSQVEARTEMERIRHMIAEEQEQLAVAVREREALERARVEEEMRTRARVEEQELVERLRHEEERRVSEIETRLMKEQMERAEATAVSRALEDAERQREHEASRERFEAKVIAETRERTRRQIRAEHEIMRRLVRDELKESKATFDADVVRIAQEHEAMAGQSQETVRCLCDDFRAFTHKTASQIDALRWHATEINIQRSTSIELFDDTKEKTTSTTRQHVQDDQLPSYSLSVIEENLKIAQGTSTRTASRRAGRDGIAFDRIRRNLRVIEVRDTDDDAGHMY